MLLANDMNKVVRTTNIISVILFKSILNVLKNGMFNLLMLTLGFCLGYYARSISVHYYATINDDYTYVEKITTHVKQLELMDKDYTIKQLELLNTLDQFKCKLSHDMHNECETKVGKVLYK